VEFLIEAMPNLTSLIANVDLDRSHELNDALSGLKSLESLTLKEISVDDQDFIEFGLFTLSPQLRLLIAKLSIT
jgi:hypothetical protein